MSAKCKINGFKYPAADTIKGRTSTICRSMACTLVVREACTPEIERIWLGFFNDKCAYCGDTATHLDHLYPLVQDREPTGYGTGPSNLVPCCGKCNQAKGNMQWEEFMRSNKCLHVVGANGNRDAAMITRINKIKEFQKVMPAEKNQIGDETKQKWCEIRDQLTSALKKAEEDLLELMNASENIVNADRQDCVYGIVQDPWIGINEFRRPYDWQEYPSLFKKEVFKKESDAISALIKEVSLEVARKRITKCDDFNVEFNNNTAKIVWNNKSSGCTGDEAAATCLHLEKISVPARYKFVGDKARVDDMGDFLNMDKRFCSWDCSDWIKQFFYAMGAYLYGGESQYTREELKSNCDWWKFIGVPADQLDKPKLVVGCPWFVDHPECAHIHLESNDWVENLRDLSEGAWDRLIKIRPQLARYKNA